MSARTCLVAALLAATPAAAHIGPDIATGVGFEQRLGAEVPLRPALGGRPGVVVLGYLACRDLCEVTLPAVAQALDRAGLVAGRDYRGIFVDIDAREGGEMLRAGRERLPVADRGGWDFLGGDAAFARNVADAVGFRYRYEPERDAFAHPAGFVVVTPDGRVSRYFFGVRFEPGEVREALAIARTDGIGVMVERLRLLCYHFDPSTGRHSAAVLQGLRLLAGLCALGLLAVLWRRRGGFR